jgi:hypothetical protein
MISIGIQDEWHAGFGVYGKDEDAGSFITLPGSYFQISDAMLARAETVHCHDSEFHPQEWI